MAFVKRSLGKIAYGILFCVFVPVALAVWARALEPHISLPAIPNPPLGILLLTFGIGIMLLGMASLWVLGGGLPMNAFPPPKYVSSGIYSLIPHPIYGGFVFATIGASIATGSAAGLWVVSPIVIIGCASIVWGYEFPDLARRFGPDVLSTTALSRDADSVPSLRERWSVYVLVFVPWLVVYEAVIHLGIPQDAVPATFPLEQKLPVLQWTELFYASTYLLALAAPFVSATARDLRKFTIRGWTALAIVFPVFFTVPLISPARPFEVTNGLGALLKWERTFDTSAAAFPSFHVIWAILSADVFATRWPRLRWLFRGWAAAITVSCVSTGMHAIVDVLAGLLLGIALLHPEAIWEMLRGSAERVANSWKEWHIGPVRIINHGLYVALAVWAGTVILGTLLGPERNLQVAALTVAGIIGAGLWAQLVEGSSGLLRPYGFYGGVLGVTLAACFTSDTLLVLTAFAVAGPVIQALGRLRCLVQGCCHGAPTSDWLGIRYRHPRSRVCKAGLNDVPVHPTQLYSILWNIPCFLLLARLWLAHTPLTIIAGAFLILNGAGRFVEEAYRGEPQTRVISGLRLYQWIAIASVLIGAAITAFPSSGRPLTPRWNPSIIGLGAVMGIITWLSMGVDFPESNRRFARLT